MVGVLPARPATRGRDGAIADLQTVIARENAGAKLQHPEVDSARVAQNIRYRADHLRQVLFGSERMVRPARTHGLGEILEAIDFQEHQPLLFERETPPAAL